MGVVVGWHFGQLAEKHKIFKRIVGPSASRKCEKHCDEANAGDDHGCGYGLG
jgi:hypothetical protein